MINAMDSILLCVKKIIIQISDKVEIEENQGICAKIDLVAESLNELKLTILSKRLQKIEIKPESENGKYV